MLDGTLSILIIAELHKSISTLWNDLLDGPKLSKQFLNISHTSVQANTTNIDLNWGFVHSLWAWRSTHTSGFTWELLFVIIRLVTIVGVHRLATLTSLATSFRILLAMVVMWRIVTIVLVVLLRILILLTVGLLLRLVLTSGGLLWLGESLLIISVGHIYIIITFN